MSRWRDDSTNTLFRLIRKGCLWVWKCGGYDREKQFLFLLIPAFVMKVKVCFLSMLIKPLLDLYLYWWYERIHIRQHNSEAAYQNKHRCIDYKLCLIGKWRTRKPSIVLAVQISMNPSPVNCSWYNKSNVVHIYTCVREQLAEKRDLIHSEECHRQFFIPWFA